MGTEEVSRPEMWSKMILDKTGSKSKQEEGGTKDRLQSLLHCRYAAINALCLQQSPKLQMHSVSAFCRESYTPGVSFMSWTMLEVEASISYQPYC